jgi:hypothetical protein
MPGGGGTLMVYAAGAALSMKSAENLTSPDITGMKNQTN